MSTLHIFNPEHDLALAVGKAAYSLPTEVENIKKKNALLPAIYAGSGDFILIPQSLSSFDLPSLPYYEYTTKKKLKVITPTDIPEIRDNISKIKPWGWDFPIRSFLEESGIPIKLLPSDTQLFSIRELSHRHTTIPMRKSIAEFLGSTVFNPAIELFEENEVDKFLLNHPIAYFKAPWSSSGRGLIVSDHIKPKGLREWTHGVIKKQGSVMAEPAWNRVFDFATEWIIENGKADFKGVSIFKTSSRGKYHGNVYGTQEELWRLIKENVPTFNFKLVEAQQYALEKHIARDYEGPAGIDMLSDNMGRINECVEINLRMTMGMVELIAEG